jgi:8-oxo-dGTP pyrophosphatase MutT (NUDIX family)
MLPCAGNAAILARSATIENRQSRVILSNMPRTTKPSLLHSNPFMRITRVDADFGKFSKSYYVVTFGPRCGVVAVRDGKILLVQQYRFLVDRLCWEIPGGKVESDETPAEAARRECREETGVDCETLEPLLVYYPGLDNVENRTSLFVCHDPESGESFAPTHDEVTACDWVPLRQAIRMVFDGEILDAMSVAGLMGYAVSRKR